MTGCQIGARTEPQRFHLWWWSLVVGYAEERAPEPPLPPEPPASEFDRRPLMLGLPHGRPCPLSAREARPSSGRTSLDGLLEERPRAGVDILIGASSLSARRCRRGRSAVGVGAVGQVDAVKRKIVCCRPSADQYQPSPVQPSVTKDHTSPASARPTSVRTSADQPRGWPSPLRQCRRQFRPDFDSKARPITVAIPESWVVGPAKVLNVQGTDPADWDRFVRYGGNPAPSESLSTSTSTTRDHPSVANELPTAPT